MFRFRIRNLREAAGYKSQYAFAQAFGVAQSTVAGWEGGKREPNYATTIRLADFFGVSVDYLLGHTDTKDSAPHSDGLSDLAGYLPHSSSHYSGPNYQWPLV